MPKAVKQLGSLLATVATLGLIAIASFGLFTAWPGQSVAKVLIVRTGSMEPTLPVGSLVLSIKLPTYTIGDIVTFTHDQRYVTHRIIGQPLSNYQTQGDANQVADSRLLTDSVIVGKVVLAVPYVDQVVKWFKSKPGFVAGVMLPALLIVLWEIRTIGLELEKQHVAKSTKSADVSADIAQKTELQFSFRRLLKKISVGALMLPVIFMGLKSSLAFFSDSGQSLTNLFTASQFVAQTLVVNEVLADSSCFQGQTEAQWLEIYNGYTTSINLKNFKISDGTAIIDLVQSNTIVAPGSFALLAHSAGIFGNNGCYDTNGVTVANLGGGQFDIDSGTLQLLDPNNTVIDTVQWGPSVTGLNPSQNQSIERDPDGKDTATGTNFAAADFVVRFTPQPGL
jgi:signal peptidase I